MNPELESLVRAFDTYLLAGNGVDAPRLRRLYEAKLEEAAAAAGIPKEPLDRAVRKKHLQWVRACYRPPTLPPRA